MTADTRTISSPGLSAEINPLGAELWALRDAQGRDLLWNGDPAFWTGRAPILFPIVGNVAGDRYCVDGKTYTLPRHGFARRRRFVPVDVRPDRVTLRLVSDDETRAVYPFYFQLDLGFAISDARLDVIAELINTGDAPLPASFGYHPAFLWSLPYGAARADHTIEFEAAETAPVYRPDAQGLLVPASRPPQLDGRTLTLDDALFADGALVFTELAGHALSYGARAGPRIRITYPDTPHLGVWSLKGAPFVCIEPWQGHADPAGFTGEIWDKPGIVRLEPGARRVWRMGIELVGSDADSQA
ncbi:aldose 1-epimerase family protein [Hyphomicrobium sp.]|uniref:aldose 1-epimerase family protein n=1 Tax=Hyphomicrobium sp. TaxID=82 RepID=UPI0025BAB3A7|nr:aldose 1-epimerase family protein [Hyphomicrobium sp.]MCC7253726.1 aldose 1-epimerase family protein [Hyphomicrobium sp.]